MNFLTLGGCARTSLAGRPSVLASVLLGFSLVLAAGCDGSSRDVREWKATDHDAPLGQQPGQVAARPRGSAEQGPDQSLVEIAWQRNCATCHGQRGRGDGPQGPMMRAPDLTRSDWQGQVTDEQMAEVIRKGRNKMPPFGTLPDQVVTGLVGRIRANRTP
jgi:mono/diheme cytochrome c family protein